MALGRADKIVQILFHAMSHENCLRNFFVKEPFHVEEPYYIKEPFCLKEPF